MATIRRKPPPKPLKPVRTAKALKPARPARTRIDPPAAKPAPPPKPAKAPKRAIRLQYGAIPYRVTKAEGVEFLLVTSRQTRRWIIPKGWPIKGLKSGKSAAREAYEEAGVRGSVGRKPIGSFTYDKLLDDNALVVPCEVHVFALRVRRQEKTWPEFHQREARWYRPDDAMAAVGEPELKALMAMFAASLVK